ncbi:hypothetical protein CGX12_02440 [Zobellella denitrificans]|jgi:hypothetical protein|uniref:Uncharacterized protein n=1 Tax=Zobellella denitrificans TaxID=347534 RepID=A0A231N2M4_9GAMM|nr:DUF1439 domain-containing protein [Zobellella denitrificans]ATG74778.1 hypothetical protein AN401_13685 [Zobellella denitrificans]OXS16652.1 hypothetical protein CGX12_02440 [Zobellella denitrificans]
MFKPLVVLFSLLLSACAGISQYSVAESEIERSLYTLLEEQAPRFTQGLVQTRVDNLDLQIGPDNRQVVRLNLKGETALNALVARFPAQLDLAIEGRPVYDRQQNAIFIRDLNLLQSKVDAFGYQGDMAAASAGMMQLVRAVLENQPVYRLDDSRYGWLKTVPVAMDIQPGRLVFSPRFSD